MPGRRRTANGPATATTQTIATWRDVRNALGRGDAVILDTRSDGEYCGTTVRAKRGGAVPAPSTSSGRATSGRTATSSRPPS